MICMEKQRHKIELSCLERPPSGFYSRFVDEWLNDNESLDALFPKTNFSMESLSESYRFFDQSRRNELCNLLAEQYKKLDVAPAESLVNIELLRQENTFTVTTGQQLHIFLGPQFVLYKIWSVIRQAKRFTKLYPGFQFVPLFWMASEDHDSEEIDHVKVFQNDFKWNLDGRRGGPTGRLSTDGLGNVVHEIEQKLHPTDSEILNVFVKYYDLKQNLADATQALILHFFGNEGLIVINPDEAELKKYIAGMAEIDLSGNELQSALTKGSNLLKQAGYKPAIGSRSTQFFIIEKEQRLRLDRTEEGFTLGTSEEVIEAEKLRQRLKSRPQDFSPNALLRPMYQQLITPTAGYVCGPSELLYWHQLHEALIQFKVPVPRLLLRDSFCFCDLSARKSLEKLDIDAQEMMFGFDRVSQKLEDRLFGELDLSKRKSNMQEMFDELLNALKKGGSKDLKSIRENGKDLFAAIQREIKSVNKEMRLKSDFSHLFHRLEKLYSHVFNIVNPQERTDFLITYYIKMGSMCTPENIVNNEDEHIFGILSEI